MFPDSGGQYVYLREAYGDLMAFLYGWMLGPDKQEVWGRPVGLLQMTDGSLLVSEDGNNKIYRISYKSK